MGRKRRRNDVEYRRKDTQAIIAKALEWRTTLQINQQHHVDISTILEIPSDRFPFITVVEFDSTTVRNSNVVAWSNLESREIELSARVRKSLLYDDLEARWEVAHEFGHIALGHPGNNLFHRRKKYTANERRFENEADAFALNFLAPFHLAKNLRTIEEYVARFRIPYDKAKIRKSQVDALRSQADHFQSPEQRYQKNLTSDDTVVQTAARASTLIVSAPRKKRPAKRKYEQLPLFEMPIDERLSEGQTTVSIVPSQDNGLQITVEDRQIVERLLQDVNRQVHRRRMVVKYIVALVVTLIGALPLALETISGLLKVLALVASGIVAGSFAFFQILDKSFRLDTKMESWSRKLLKRLANKRGVHKKLEGLNIGYSNGKFEIL